VQLTIPVRIKPQPVIEAETRLERCAREMSQASQDTDRFDDDAVLSFSAAVDWSPWTARVGRVGESLTGNLDGVVVMFLVDDGEWLLLVTEVRYKLASGAIRPELAGAVSSQICAVAISSAGAVQGNGSRRVFELLAAVGWLSKG
jgi:hypothetical protein